MNFQISRWIRPCRSALSLAALLLASTAPAFSEERVVKIAGMGAESGVLRPFGVNSEAAMRAAADAINTSGGVRLAGGVTGKIVVDYFDDRCNPQEGIATARKIASDEWLAVIGTTCSSVLEPIFGALQKKAGDASDMGIAIPIFADVAMKTGLAQVSDWSFRNIPDEVKMYDTLWAWVKANHSDAHTVYGGVEENFVHSRQTWYDIIKESAKRAGYDVRGEAKWLVDDTNFAAQVSEMKRIGADVVAISAHPFTACGVLREMERQGVKPKVLVGLTSVTSPEALKMCGKQAEGMLVPTSFAVCNPDAAAAARATAEYHGYADLHSMAAWENMFALKRVIEVSGVVAHADTVSADRERIRAGLANLTQIDGLLGSIGRTAGHESVKPFVLVKATDSAWQIISAPVE